MIKKLRFIQIVAGQEDVKVYVGGYYRYAPRIQLYGLDANGRVWELLDGGWQRVTDQEAG